MYILLYLLSFYLVFRSLIKTKTYLTCCSLVLVYYTCIYAFNPSEVSWNNDYLASFIVCFALGTLFYPLGNFLSKPINLNKNQKQVLKKLVLGLLAVLVFVATIRVALKWFYCDDKSYMGIRLLLKLNLSYWDYVIFFKFTLFVYTLILIKIKNKMVRCFLFLLFVAILSMPMHKSLVFYFLLMLALYSLLKKQEKIKNVFILGGMILFFGFFIMCMFNKRLVFYKKFSSRCFSAVSKISYLTLNWAKEQKYITYGSSSFGSLIKSTELPLAKKTMNLYNKKNVNSRDSLSGAGANTPMPIPLYVDFRYGALIFAFLLGFCLRIYDEIALLHFRKCGYTTCTALAYCCSLVLSLQFNITALGTALLSGGFFFYTVLLFIFSKLEEGDNKQ